MVRTMTRDSVLCMSLAGPINIGTRFHNCLLRSPARRPGLVLHPRLPRSRARSKPGGSDRSLLRTARATMSRSRQPVRDQSDGRAVSEMLGRDCHVDRPACQRGLQPCCIC